LQDFSLKNLKRQSAPPHKKTKLSISSIPTYRDNVITYFHKLIACFYSIHFFCWTIHANILPCIFVLLQEKFNRKGIIMKKLLKFLGIVLVLIIVVVIAALLLYGGPIIKQTVNKAAPAILKVPVKIEYVQFRPFAGEIKLKDLMVGNPQGFNTPSMLALKELEVKINLKSILSDTITVNKVLLYSPHITYEQSLKGNNFDALLKNLEGEKPATKETQAKQPKKEGEKKQKKVIIEKTIIDDPQVNLSITAAGGKSLPIKIARIELNDLGKAEGGVSAGEVVKILLSTIGSNIKQAASGTTSIITTNISAIAEKAKSIFSSTSNVSSVAENAKAMVGTTTSVSAIADNAKSAAQTATNLSSITDSTKLTTEAATNSAPALIKNIGGFLKKKE
jgi:uncharacterized protein involved in outer membrane biogenesis